MAPTFKPDRIITVLGDQLTDEIAALRSGNRGTDIVLISDSLHMPVDISNGLSYELHFLIKDKLI